MGTDGREANDDESEQRDGKVSVFRGGGIRCRRPPGGGRNGLPRVAASAQASDRWLRSYDEAMEAAERTGRPVLTIFTGSDWCPHCVTLEKKVLDSQQFLAWAENRVVLLMIDLPQQGISQDDGTPGPASASNTAFGPFQTPS